MAVTKDKPAPYAPAKTILDIIDRYRHRGLPSPIEAEILARAGVPGSLVPRTLQALQTLDLITDAGAPTPTFEGLRLAPETEFRKRLEDWLKGTYADVFSFVDPAKDNPTRVRDAFRSYSPVGQQERMVTLFQGLCAAAGLIADKPATASASVRPRSAGPQSPRRPIARKPAAPKPDMGTGSVGLPPALAGLLASLPALGSGWTADRRQKFLTTFAALLDYFVPIVEDASEQAYESAATDEAA